MPSGPRKTFRHRPIGESGRDHRATTRHQADDAHRRGARNSARRRHQPAQRRGQGEPVLLRGFNLDHGTDFATDVAGMPVNMPTHAHGQGYSDLNFLIPVLVSGVPFSKGPYFAERGDFATAGAASISYANSLEKLIVSVGGGADAFG